MKHELKDLQVSLNYMSHLDTQNTLQMLGDRAGINDVCGIKVVGQPNPPSPDDRETAVSIVIQADKLKTERWSGQSDYSILGWLDQVFPKTPENALQNHQIRAWDGADQYWRWQFVPDVIDAIIDQVPEGPADPLFEGDTSRDQQQYRDQLESSIVSVIDAIANGEAEEIMYHEEE